MIYHAIGLMSGSSLDGLDICFAELTETGGAWSYEIQCAACKEYEPEWTEKLKNAIALPAKDYQLLHTAYGHYLGNAVNDFIDEFGLHHRAGLIGSHGHTTFHMPEHRMTHQLGDGAAIAAVTGLPVVSDLRAMDIAFGGQGAPIVPMGERLLFPSYECFLNIGGIANISFTDQGRVMAYDICPANRVLNMLAQQKNRPFDEGGRLASEGKVHQGLLQQLNELVYYAQPYPKSLANDFGTDVVYPLIRDAGLTTEDALCTFTEHIAWQLKKALEPLYSQHVQTLVVTGGGAFNTYLLRRMANHLQLINFEIFTPKEDVITYKESLIMALLGVLRWREQYTVFSSVTGASRDSIGGALWLGTEA